MPKLEHSSTKLTLLLDAIKRLLSDFLVARYGLKGGSLECANSLPLSLGWKFSLTLVSMASFITIGKQDDCRDPEKKLDNSHVGNLETMGLYHETASLLMAAELAQPEAPQMGQTLIEGG